jgi:AraC-like DNA-binding protein
MDLLGTPEDISFLSNTIQREIVYRLLRDPQGERRRCDRYVGGPKPQNGEGDRLAQGNFDKALHVVELAEVARMGSPTLLHHCRALTAMSPLRYQKQLRLYAARGRMLLDGLDAASAAFEVGYESASQFSPESRRFFGQPPRRDIKARRPTGSATVRA